MPGLFRTLAGQLTGALGAAALATAPVFAQGLIRDTEIEAVMREYTDPLLEAADLDTRSVDVYLIGDMEFNAFVTQGQNIFLHTGLIVRAENPGEIKGVIAHEIGHIEGAHLARTGEAARGGMATMAASIGIGLIAAMAGAGSAGAAIIASAPQFAQMDMLRYSRGQEASADQAAVRLLTATGQSGRGLVTTFERLAYQERMSMQRRWEYFRSHPLSSDRVSALRRNVEASPFVDTPDTQEEIDTLRRIQAKIIGFMVPPAQTFNRFPDSDTSFPARYARAVAYYKQGLTDRAEEEVDGLLELEPENAFLHELKGQMLYESGRIDQSVAPYRRAVDLMPQAALLRIGLAGSLIAHGDEAGVREAVGHLNFALVNEPDNTFGWFQKSLAHQALGETAMAELATAERAYHTGDEMQAHIFAQRAHEDLERGTEGWIRAAEIIAVTQPTSREVREWNRVERGRRPNF
ncbi:M48 family metalloprotease [Maricaulaceae bacterium MS644]